MKRFSLSLATIPRRDDLFNIDFNVGEYPNNFDAVLKTLPDEIHYGALFAYLFRRFGYPNRGWDDYKNLACYMLSTPLPDLWVRITPYVGNNTSISFQFVGLRGHYEASRAWEETERDVWRTRRFEWIKPQLPVWIDEWVQFVAKDVGFTPDLQGALNYTPMYSENERARELNVLIASFPEPRPDMRDRPLSIAEWADDDPLKPLALAGVTALKDLLRPVRVRDCAINALGRADELPRCLTETKGAGWAAGPLNTVWAETHEIWQMAERAGNGNLKRGMKKILKKAELAL